MRSKTSFRILIPALVICALAGLPSRAQDRTAPIVIAKPLRTKPVKPPKANFEVLHMMTTGIQVRSITNGYEIHTFTYADPIRERMVNMVEQNAGFQYGDKVEIVYQPETQVALKIRGKPSKPL